MVDVAHQVGEHVGQGVRSPFVGVGRARAASAARRWRSGEASKVHRNASGAVSETAMPCGTIGSSPG